MSDKGVLLSQPKDRSLEAYKAWIREIVKHIAGKAPRKQMTDEQWEVKWKEFWRGQ